MHSNLPILRWILVGALTTGLDYLTFLIVFRNLSSVFIANLISGIFATSINYYFHHSWTFNSSLSHSSTGPRYFFSLTFWWISSTFLINWLVVMGIRVEFAKLAPVLILLPINYLILKKLVFKK
jgi:putative flippase GtrA